MKASNFTRLLDFIRKLDAATIAFDLRRSRYDALMVSINVPGERWEVEFLEDDEIEVERFCSNGEIGDEKWLDDLFARFSDTKPDTKPAARAVKNHAVRTRK